MSELSKKPESLPYGRWACLLALLVTEFIAISLRYDAAGIGRDRALHELIMWSGTFARLGLVIGLASLMVVLPRCHGLLKREVNQFGHAVRRFPLIAGNLLAFMAFYRFSGLVLEGPPSLRYSDQALAAAWGMTGVATLVLWAMAVVPARSWWPLLRQCGWSLAAGPALGATAFLCGLLARDQWKTLSQATLRTVAFLLSAVFRETVCQPEIAMVGTPSYAVQIAPACSGYEGVGLIVALLCIALWLFRRDLRFPRALVLLPVGIILIWLSNAFRIAALVALGSLGYPEFALGGFHSLAGWVIFLLIGLGLIALTRQSAFFSTHPGHDSGNRHRPAALDGAYLVPPMAIIATTMVTVSFSPGFDRYYPARVIVATAALVFFRKSYTELRLRWSWEALAIGCAVFAFWVALEPLAASPSGGMSTRSGLETLAPGWATVWLFFRVAGSVIIVPLAEELAFRGYLTRRLIAADFQSIAPGRMTWWSMLLSSVLFGALHGRWFAGTLAGVAYAFAYRRRGELADAVVAHGVTNGLIAIAVLTTGSWSLWS